MFVFQWHFDIPFGKQKEALDILRAWEGEWLKDAAAASETPPRNLRLMVGHLGLSPSHIISEWTTESMDAFDDLGAVLATGRYQKYSDRIAPLIVPGSQHWVVLRVADLVEAS